MFPFGYGHRERTASRPLDLPAADLLLGVMAAIPLVLAYYSLNPRAFVTRVNKDRVEINE